MASRHRDHPTTPHDQPSTPTLRILVPANQVPAEISQTFACLPSPVPSSRLMRWPPRFVRSPGPPLYSSPPSRAHARRIGAGPQKRAACLPVCSRMSVMSRPSQDEAQHPALNREPQPESSPPSPNQAHHQALPPWPPRSWEAFLPPPLLLLAPALSHPSPPLPWTIRRVARTAPPASARFGSAPARFSSGPRAQLEPALGDMPRCLR